MNLASWLVRTATRLPDAPAIMLGQHLLSSYRQFAARAADLASWLATSRSIQPGDRIAIFLPNCAAYLELLYAIWHAGAVAVPINAKLHPGEATWIVQDSGASLVFAAGKNARALALSLGHHGAIVVDPDCGDLTRLPAADIGPVPREETDLAWLFYTSGTTGRPKGAMLTHGNLAAMALSYFADVDDVLDQDVAVYAAPLSHGAGLYNFMHVLRGARHCIPESGGFDAAEILELAAQLGNVTMFAAPTMVRRLSQAARATGSTGQGLRTIVYGGGPMYFADIEEAVALFGARFVQIYGQGESPMTITALSRSQIADRAHPRWRERLASVGQGHCSVEVLVADEKGHSLPAGRTGEVLVRGPTVMKGYWNAPEASALALRNGWLRTGDLGSMDDDGFLTLKDRSKDVIISGGSNIYPREIEEIMLHHPGVLEAAAIGRPDPEWGEIPVLYFVGSASHPELDAWCLDHLARFKRPKEYVLVRELPKNNYGKVLKTDLRKADQALCASRKKVDI